MSAPGVVRVVLLVGADGDAPPGGVLESEATPFGTLLSRADTAVEVNVVSAGTSRTFVGATVHVTLNPSNRSLTDRVLRALGGFALSDRLATFPIGRLLNSIGPIAPSRVFWRTLKRNPEAMDLLRTSDVAIAADLETTKAAWLAVRRGWVDAAHYDHRAVSLALTLQAPSAT